MDSIIFDVDGTLWDSTEIVATAWTAYLQNEEHLDITLTSARLMTLFGQPLSDIARQIFPDFPESEQLRLIDGCCQAEHDALLKECAPLYEDLEKMLQIMSQKYPLYIVSNSQSGYIEVFLQTSGLGKYFKGHLCNGDTGLDKGSNIRRIADTYSLKAPVYVGDTLGDYQACQKAGVPFILAEYGFGEVSDPDARISKPMDLVKISL
ncbi:HAD family hydrolase [Blautia sp. MSJ-19]|uniref:HAD family hydrolase n=1 Tax=Blautia sp. MSJ-19 TaxID=2841517 RepID=UPI001C0F3365|nr:HAD family hydrolase [Blautia sp. MSJ-19]MBU5480049.1 HAD family hydrolase [Blautia sp. MSJ-19]